MQCNVVPNLFHNELADWGPFVAFEGIHLT